MRKLLQKVGLDRHLHESDANKYVERIMPGASPANGIARVVFWLIFIFFLFSAIGALKIPAVTTFMNQVLAYLPNIIAAIFIFVAAALIAGAIAAGVAKTMGDTPTGKIVATIAPALVMVIAMFMILEQLNIAEQIVEIAFAATMGALALGLALAFGLGGRGVAERMLEDAYRKGQENRDQVRPTCRRPGPCPGPRLARAVAAPGRPQLHHRLDARRQLRRHLHHLRGQRLLDQRLHGPRGHPAVGAPAERRSLSVVPTASGWRPAHDAGRHPASRTSSPRSHVMAMDRNRETPENTGSTEVGGEHRPPGPDRHDERRLPRRRPGRSATTDVEGARNARTPHGNQRSRPREVRRHERRGPASSVGSWPSR